jgi:MFS family permease
MVASLVSAAINLRFLKETSPRARNALHFGDLPKVLKSAYTGIPGMLRRWPRSLKAMAVVIVLAVTANAISGPFWVVYAVQKIGLESTEWGLILLVQTLLRNIAYIPAGMIVDRHGRTKFLIGALILSLVSVPSFVLASTFTQVLLIRAAIAITNAFFTPACSALLADLVPRDIRGRVMAAIGRGSVIMGASSGGTGGPGMGFLITIPVMVASLVGGYLYEYNPILPWLFTASASSIGVILAVLFIRDPQQAHL